MTRALASVYLLAALCVVLGLAYVGFKIDACRRLDEIAVKLDRMNELMSDAPRQISQEIRTKIIPELKHDPR